MCLIWSRGNVRASTPPFLTVTHISTQEDRTNDSFLPLTALDFSSCRLPNCTTLHHDVNIPHWHNLATIAQRTLLLHLPLRSLVHRVHCWTPKGRVWATPPDDEDDITFKTTYSEPGFGPFAQPWPDLTTVHLDEAPHRDWAGEMKGHVKIQLLPMADWRIEVLIIDVVDRISLHNLFFPRLRERLKNRGWSSLRRIELRAPSGEVEDEFRAYLAKWKVKRGLTSLQLRILPLVVFNVRGGGGQDRRLVEDGSLP